MSEKELRQWKLIAEFRAALEGVCEGRAGHPSWEDKRRKLEQLNYLSLFLFALANPVVKTMRAVCEASRLQRVQEEVCGQSVSLGSFSEAQHLVEGDLLEKLIASLSQKIKGPEGSSPGARTACYFWRREHFSGADLLDDNISGSLASITPDGLKNFYKYAFGFDPYVTVTNNPMNVTLVGDRLHITFPRDPIKTDLTYEVQASTNLSTWDTLAQSVAGGTTLNLNAFRVSETPTNSVINVTVDDLATTGTISSRFIRMRVSR